MGRESSINLRIIEHVATREGVEPAALSPPLHTAIDTDALEALYDTEDSRRSKPRISFEYLGYEVQVDTDGTVHLEESAQSIDSGTQGLSY